MLFFCLFVFSSSFLILFNVVIFNVIITTCILCLTFWLEKIEIKKENKGFIHTVLVAIMVPFVNCI